MHEAAGRRLQKQKTAILGVESIKKFGEFRESNPGPLAPKARIIPLDQTPTDG